MAIIIMLFITIHSILLFITFLSYVSCSVTYTFEFPTGYWSYSVTWQRNATNDEHGEEGQPLTEEEALAISNIYDEDEETRIEDEDHFDPYGDEESKQILPFQRTGDMDWNPILQTWEQRGGEREPVLAQNDWDTDGLRWAQDDWATHPSTPEPPPPYPHEEFNDLPELEEVEEEPHPVLMIVNHTEEDSEEEDEEIDDE